jgi:GT2 family glycosyltransferase/SAM-dependent methyltransferase
VGVDVTEEDENLAGARPRKESVAVVVTTFNDADFLHEALTSIVSQQELATEIIVADDGSDESPAAILANFPGVVLLRKNNGGLSSARNAGLRKARSEYITFLDADDRLEPNAIAAGLACFRENPEAVMVYGGHRRISADGKPLSGGRYTAPGADPYAGFLSGNIVGMHATVLYRREVLEVAGGFDEGLRMCEDYDLYLRLARDYRIASHSAIIAEYRWHEQNMSKNTQEMLRTVLFVHGRHRNQTRGRRLAWQTGRRQWKRWYSVEQPALWEGANGSLKTRTRVASTIRRTVKAIGKRGSARLSRLLGRNWPPQVGSIDFGHLGTTRPISLDFGWDRGRPIDRYYVENFLARQASDIAGRVLEVGDDAYSRTYGGAKISRQDVLHVESGNPKATLIGDLTDPGVLPPEAFDCIVLTQTLHFIFDLPEAVTRLHAALKPGGVLLLTTPGISQIDRGQWRDRWYWSLTALSLRRLFEASFSAESLSIEAHGNVFAAIAYLTGAVCEDVDRAKLDVQDAAYPVIITMRAQKA